MAKSKSTKTTATAAQKVKNQKLKQKISLDPQDEYRHPQIRRVLIRGGVQRITQKALPVAKQIAWNRTMNIVFAAATHAYNDGRVTIKGSDVNQVLGRRCIVGFTKKRAKKVATTASEQTDSPLALENVLAPAPTEQVA